MTAIEAVAMLGGLSESDLFRWAVRAKQLSFTHGDVPSGALLALQEIADAREAKDGAA
jgi:hypothetical protein